MYRTYHLRPGVPTFYTKLKARYGPADRKPGAAGGVSGLAVHRTPLLSERLTRGPRANQKRIVIVGAGFAGLAAAFELYQAGYDVFVVEARKRLGGRVFSLNDVVSGKNVEGGGELIGSNHPTWHSYRDRFRLHFLDVHDGTNAPMVLKGHVLTRKEAKRVSDEFDRATDIINQDAQKVCDPFQPWLPSSMKTFDSVTLASQIKKMDVSELCKRALAAQLSNDNGVSTARQSYLGVLAMVAGGGGRHYWSESEVFRCDGGNQQLAVELARDLDDKHLKMNSPVAALQIKESGVSVMLRSGEHIDADDVVLAVPPSVWHRIKVDFEPPIASALKKHPQMGVNVKFLITLCNEFWRGTGVSPDMSSDHLVGDTWCATQGQPGPGEALTVFSGSDGAVEARSWPPLRRPEKYMRVLKQAYKRMEASYVEGRFMNWPDEEWTQASYSFPAPGEVMKWGPVLHDGLLGRLHFAGEHTCYGFVGYMEGALYSGVSLAKRIARRDRVHSDPQLF